MRIGIDARLYATKNGGIGRFTEELVLALTRLNFSARKGRPGSQQATRPPSENVGGHTFVVFLRAQDMGRVRTTKNIQKVCADIQPFTFKEQIVLPRIFKEAKLDALHIPHHAIAGGYKGKKIITVHDLMEYRADRSHATSLSPFVYRMKRKAFRGTLSKALHQAAAIVAVSRHVRKDVARTFPSLKTDILVIHHGAPVVSAKKFSAPVAFPYILYVGSLDPHKNIGRLLDAYRHAVENAGIAEHLVLIVPNNFHFRSWTNTLQLVRPSVRKRIHILHAVSDARLAQYMTHARLFVSASRQEGYGLPCVESLACGTSVLAGFTGVLPEISVHFPVGKVLYWDTSNVSLMAKKLIEILQTPLEHFDGRPYRKRLISWNDVAKQYVKLYDKILEN